MKNRDCQRHGLVDGLAGYVMWFEHYWRYSGQKEWDDYASLLWEQVICAVEDRTLPWYFVTGTAGIGWLIHYLYNHGFIDRLPDDTLELIDKQVSEIALDCVEDTSIDFGLSGIMAYCCVRRRFSKHNPFSETFTNKITDSANYIIHNSNNIRELSFAYYWKSLALEEQAVEYEIPLSVNDIVEVREHFAQNSEYWNDCIDFSVLASFILKFSATEKFCKK